MRSLLSRLFLLMCWAMAAWPFAAAGEGAVASDITSWEDPTILSRRVWLDTEWSKYRDDSSNLDETLGGLWVWSVATDQDWAVRAKLPYKWHLAGDPPGDSYRHGLGDLKLATGTAWRLGTAWRTGLGLELRLPSGEDEMSENVWKLQEFGAVAWDAAGWLTVSPSFEYNQSLREEGDAAPQHYLELYFPLTFVLPDKWTVTTRYEAKVDFENDNTCTQSAKLSLAKQLSGSPLGFGLSVKKPFNSGPKDFQVNIILTYYFREQAGGK